MKAQPLHNTRASGLSTALLLLASLAGGTLAFLALIARVYGFWLLSRWPRLILLGMGALLCGLLNYLALRAVWSKLSVPPRARKLAWLGAAFAAGILIKLLWAAPAPAMPLLYVLDIQTPGNGAKNGGPVAFMELRDYSGKPVPLVELHKEGAWQPIKGGLLAQSSQPTSLRYSFYAPSQGKIQLLFEEQPNGGQVQVAIDGQQQQVNLSSASQGQRLVDVPFQKQSRWSKPILLADIILIGLVFPLVLFLVPFAMVDGARLARRWATSPQLQLWSRRVSQQTILDCIYPKVFIAAFIGLCLLPFTGFKGDLSTIDQFFGLNNGFWNTYSRIRQQVFQDRFVGNALIGKNGWLVMTTDLTLEDYQNTIPLTEEELFQMQQRIDGTTRYLNKKGITFLVVIPPNKSTVYPDRLPAQIQVIGKQSRLDQFMEYQRRHGTAQILDLRQALNEASRDHEVYYATDTHWNPYGAYAAYAAIIRALQKEYPELTPHELSDFRYNPTGELLGDIARRWVQGAPGDPDFSLTPLFARNIASLTASSDRFIYSYQYNKSNIGLPTAVIYHDSFMDPLAPFLMDHFSKAVFSRALDMDKGMDEQLIENEKPDIVIYECNERYLSRLLSLPMHSSPGE